MRAGPDHERAGVAAGGGLGVTGEGVAARCAGRGASVWLGTATPSVANHALTIVPPAQARSERGWEESVPAYLRRRQLLQRTRPPLPASGKRAGRALRSPERCSPRSTSRVVPPPRRFRTGAIPKEQRARDMCKAPPVPSSLLA